jgi:hypothetical protein
MAGARITLGHCTCDQWCPCWMFVIFRANFESMSRWWCVSSVSLYFHEVLMIIYILPALF